jgi:hypothetical protein
MISPVRVYLNFIGNAIPHYSNGLNTPGLSKPGDERSSIE